MSTFEKAEKLARKAWLANLGMYGSGWKYAIQKLDQTYTKTNALVNELVSEGEKIEAEIKSRLKAKEVIDSKVSALKDKLGLNEASEADRLASLAKKVEDLASIVSSLAEKKSAKAAPKAAKKKATKSTKA